MRGWHRRCCRWGRSGPAPPPEAAAARAAVGGHRRCCPYLAPPHHSRTPLHTPQVDPDLSPLQAVQEWAAEGNPPGQRVAYIMSIPAAAAECSLAEARLVLLPLLAQLVFDDHPDIKQATAEVLGPLGARTEAWAAWQRCWAAPRVLLQRLPCTAWCRNHLKLGGCSSLVPHRRHIHAPTKHVRGSRKLVGEADPTRRAHRSFPCPPGPILASKDPEAGEAGGSEDAFELLVLAHRLLQDPERAVGGGVRAGKGWCAVSCGSVGWRPLQSLVWSRAVAFIRAAGL